MYAYRYAGPDELRVAATSQPPGREIRSREALREWLASNPEGLTEAATFVVNLEGRLLLAPRRSEHVACASGHEVLAAGEIRFRRRGDGFAAAEVTNQSTGYCPDVDCWPAVKAALESAGVAAGEGWSRPFVFRCCTACRELNVVKESWFVCAFCDAELPKAWNVSERRPTSL
ncbi:MAG: hypothetical protein JNK82_32185 [Myxococcaceae bacterium]|nr:hypothetical protein [Myxococcaceae bacterium]